MAKCIYIIYVCIRYVITGMYQLLFAARLRSSFIISLAKKKKLTLVFRSSGNGNYNGMGGKMRASLNLYYIRMSR